MAKAKIPQRTCVATGAVGSKADLLRFVRMPEGMVAFDVTGTAPGRGAYCLPSQAAMQLAIKKKALARKLEGQVPDDLAVLVEQALKVDALRHLGLAKKAGALVLGVDEILKQHAALVGVLPAADAGKDARQRLTRVNTEFCGVFFNAELAEALGQPHVAAIGLTDDRFWPKFRRLNAYFDANEMN